MNEAVKSFRRGEYNITMDHTSFVVLKRVLIGCGLAGIMLGLLSVVVERVFKVVERNKQ